MTEDFYDLLDVPPDASQDEIKDAYREQVRVYHPDLNDDDRAQAQFTAVKKAYDILGDPVERQAYDRLGHEEYVAKRTSGLPSPDVWKRSDDSDDESDAAAESERAEATAGASATGASASRSGSSAGASATSSSANTGAGSTSSAAGTGSASGGSTGSAGSGSGSASASASATGTAGGSATGSTDGGTARANGGATGSTAGAGTGTGTGRSRSRSRSTNESGPFGDNAVARWWRRQNFSLPLIWLSVLIYLTGLGHFALENESGLEALRAELAAAGTDAGALWEALSTDRYGIDSSVEYLSAFELLAPPLEVPLWYAALAGVVALTLIALVGVRAYRDGETWGPVSIDETIVVALALTATTVLVGGPLLAGAVLMPVLFAVIVRHTRRGPGWAPSYLYLLPVLAPLAGFAAAAADAATLAVDLAALVVLPLLGGLALPLRATIRKRFGK